MKVVATKLLSLDCDLPAFTSGVRLQLNYGLFKIFGAEGQISLSTTSHGQVIWTQTWGGVTGVNNGVVLSGTLQGGASKTDFPAGISPISTLGGEIIATDGAGFSAGASEATDASGITVNALGRAGCAAGEGLVSGMSYQHGLTVASPSLCSH